MNIPNLPDIHALDRDIPPSKVLLAEYGTTTGQPRPDATILDTKVCGRRRIRLEAVTAGWAIAGSVLRWDNGYFAVRWDERDGTTHGRRFRELADAVKHFNRLI